MSQTIGTVVGQMEQGRTDASLLADFVERQDAEAFRKLVERHAGLVWSVCKRIVRRHQTAEDAFQATFVVLMQKAPRLKLHSQLSTWLYGVAVKIARRSQARDARLHSEQVTEASVCEQQSELTVRELMEIVQCEVQRLPRRYQPVLELCLFNQMPVRQAAERLQLTTGMVRGCLERGRKQLQARLLRRGIAPLALGTLSLTALNAHPVSIDLVAVVQGMVNQEVPARLMALTATSLSTFRAVVGQLLLVILLITGVGLGVASLFARSAPGLPALVNSVPKPEKSSEAIQGFVSDHLGNPVPRMKVEVYQDGHLEQEIQADGVGRFMIPQTWFQEPDVTRKLIIRQGTEGLGWYTLFSRQPSPTDVRITVLPLQAEVKGTLCKEKGDVVSSQNKLFPYFGHRGNGWLSSNDVAQVKAFRPVSTDAQGQFSIKFPIQTQGFILVNCSNCVSRRIPYVSVGPGQCDLGKLHLSNPGLIQGTVTDEQGAPLSGVSILAEHNWKAQPEELPFLQGTSSEAVSDAKGHFVLDGLEPRAKFNIMLKENYKVPGKEEPLVLRAIEGISLSRDKPTEVNLKLEPGRKLVGKIVDAKTEAPLKDVRLGYQGSGRPDSSSSIVVGKSDQAGEFHFWVPHGQAHVTCNDGKHQAIYYLAVDETSRPPLVLLKAEKIEASRHVMGQGMSTSQEVLKPRPGQPVLAEGDMKLTETAWSFMHQIEFQTEKKLPSRFSCRVYQNDKVLISNDMIYQMPGSQMIIGNSAVVHVPLLENDNCTLEIDVKGFIPQLLPIKVHENREVLTIKLVSAEYVSFQVQVLDTQGKQAAQTRLQVELKRLGTTVDAPWGPVLITDEQGKGRIEHLRVGDTFRLRAWGQDGSTAVTEWKTMTVEAEKVVTMKLAAATGR